MSAHFPKRRVPQAPCQLPLLFVAYVIILIILSFCAITLALVGYDVSSTAAAVTAIGLMSVDVCRRIASLARGCLPGIDRRA